jgi:oligo-1,6-glucosidase
LHKILKELRHDVLDKYDCFTVGETVFVTTETAKDLCNDDELNMIFAFEHMESDNIIVKWFRRKFNAKRFAKALTKWQVEHDWNANYFENHDQQRAVSRFGDDREYWEKSSKMLCTLLFSLRGTPYIYQGQEIGMTNFDFKSMDEIEDVESHNIYKLAKKMGLPKAYRWHMMKTSSRDNGRTPVQWSADKNGGFTKGSPWLGVNSNHTRINMESQMEDANSIRSYFKKMIALRASSDVLIEGTFKPLKMTKNLFLFERQLDGKKVAVLLNFSKRNMKADYKGKVMISNYDNTEYNGVLEPYEAVILEAQS